jgi:hypothetical protein
VQLSRQLIAAANDTCHVFSDYDHLRGKLKAMSTFCVNQNCACAVGNSGDACCAECAEDAANALTGACGCGHQDCEPKGLEREAESQETALPV